MSAQSPPIRICANMTRSAVASEAAEYAMQVRQQHCTEVRQIAHRLLEAITHETPLSHYTDVINTAILGLVGVNYMTMASIRNFEEFFSSIGVNPEQQADSQQVPDQQVPEQQEEVIDVQDSSAASSPMPPLVEDTPAPEPNYDTDDDSLSQYEIHSPELIQYNAGFYEAGQFVHEPVLDID